MDVISITVCPQGIEETRRVLEAMLEAVVVANELYFRRLPAGPCCPECASVKYAPPSEKEASSPGEHFESAERLVVVGEGACGSIAAMVAARKRVDGVNARVKLVPTSSTDRRYHAVVELPDGTVEDPTEKLPRAVSVGARPATFPSCGCGGL